MTATRSTSRILLLFVAVLLAIAPGCRSTSTSSSTSTNPSPDATSARPSTPASTSVPSSPTVSTAPSQPAVSAEPIDCSNPTTDRSINACAQQAYESADAKLNQVYRQFKTSLSQQEQSELVDVETAWLKFRDSSCEFESSRARGQSTQSSIRYQCLEQMTKDRTAELQLQASPL
jgi:uncharacterized protein YecT (DUF1311 family)